MLGEPAVKLSLKALKAKLECGVAEADGGELLDADEVFKRVDAIIARQRKPHRVGKVGALIVREEATEVHERRGKRPGLQSHRAVAERE